MAENDFKNPQSVQDYSDPLTKFKKNPVREDIFEQIQRKKAEQQVVKANQTKAKKKDKIAAKAAVSKTTVKPIDKLRTGPVWQYIEDIAPTFEFKDDPDAEAEFQAKQYAAEWNQQDEIKEAAKSFDKELAKVPDIKFGGFGPEIPGSGMFISSVTRGLMQTGAAVTDEFAKVLASAVNVQKQAAIDNALILGDEKPITDWTIKNPIGEFAEWLGAQSEDAVKVASAMGGEKSKRSTVQRIGELTGSIAGRLPSMLLITEAAGPIVGFGTMQAMQARARGVTDPKELAMEFTWGAIKGKVFQAAGKTGEWMEKVGVAQQGGSYFATGVQSTAQFVTGVGEQVLETGLHPTMEKPDAFDYLSAGFINVILDPILLPGGSKKAIDAVETTRKFNGANLELPNVNRDALTKNFFHDNVPVENITTLGLLKRAKVQYVPEQDVLWANPAGGSVIARAAAALGNSKLDGAEGTVFTAKQVDDLVNLLGEKSVQIQEIIKGIEEPTKDVNGLVEAAILYESLAEHLSTAVEGKDKVTVRFAGKEDSDLTVIAHEKIHESQMDLAREVGSTLYDVQHPNFLLEHPLGAKFISEHGELLDNYKAHQWTAEAMAYVAQPGNNFIKLNPQERGILFGDYLASVADRHGAKSLGSFDVSWADREVARNAFNRLAQRNYVELKKDKGIPVGLIWKDSDYRPMYQQGGKLVGGGDVLPPMIIGDRVKVNQAIKANDLQWRLKDSKAKHDDGELIRVYHGSPKGLEIKEVDFDKLNKNDWIKGFFTTQSAETASGYSGHGGFGTVKLENQGSNVHGFYLDIKNPLDLDGKFELIAPTKEVKKNLANFYEVQNSFFHDMRNKYGDNWVTFFEGVGSRIKPEFGGADPTDITQWKTLIQEGETLAKLAEPTHPLKEAAKKLGLPEDFIDRVFNDARDFYDIVYGLKEQFDSAQDIIVVRDPEYLKLLPERDAAYNKMRDAESKVQELDYIHGGYTADGLKKHKAEVTKAALDAVAEYERAEAALEARRREIQPEDMGLEMTRQVFIQAGYDGATHLGGEGRGKEFTDKVEAERYARETGGQLGEQSYLINPPYDELPTLAAKYPIALDLVERIHRCNFTDPEELLSALKQFTKDFSSDLPIEDLHFPKPWSEVYKDIENFATELQYVFDHPEYDFTYKVNGHKVWIAFKPEQVISATALDPIVEPYLDSVEYRNQKLQWEKNRIEYEAKRAEMLEEAKRTLVDWKQNEAARLLEDWQIETEDTLWSNVNGNFDKWIEEKIPVVDSPVDDWDLPLSIKDPATDVNESASGKTDQGSDLEQFYLIDGEFKDVSRQHLAKKAQINLATKVGKYLTQLKNSGVDVSDALKANSDELIRLLDERRKLADEKIRLRKILRDSWVPIAEDYEKTVKASIQSQLNEGTQRYLDNVNKADEKVKAINEDPERLGLTWKEGLDQNIIKLVNFKRIAELGADVIKSLGIELLSTNQRSIHRQLMDAVNNGAIDVDNFNAALEKYGMTLPEMVDSFIYAGSEAGRILQTLSVVKKDLSKMMKDSPETLGPNLQKLYGDIPELQAWFENNTPTLQEIKGLVKGRNNIMRFISINNGAALLTIATQSTNFVVSAAKLLGKGFENYLEAIEGRIREGKYDSLLPNGTVEEKTLKANTIGESFRPTVELASILNFVTGIDKTKSIGRYITSLKEGVKWMDEGVVPSGRPSSRSARAIDIITDIQKVFPKTYDQLFASLNGDFESMDIPVLEQTLNTMKRQVELMTDGPIKEKKLKEIANQQIKLKREGGHIAKALRGGEYVIHKLMLLGRGPERVLRGAAFVGQLDYYAKRYNQDIYQLAKDGKLNEVHPDALLRATNDALEITYGKQPRNNYDNSVESMYASYLKFLRAGENPLSVGINVAQAYQNYIVQATKEAYSWSPLGYLRYWRYIVGNKTNGVADGNYRNFNKALVGTIAYTYFQLRANEKYDEAERLKQPPPNPSWDDLGGFSMKGTPLGPMMFVADAIARYNRGLPMSEKNFARALSNLAVDFRGVTGIFDWMDGFYERFARNPDKNMFSNAGDELMTQMGQWFSKFEGPLRNYTDFAGELDKDQRTLKDIYGWGYGNLVSPLLDKLPSSFIKPDGTRMHLRDLLYDRIDPYTGRPMMRNHPAARALTGFNLIPEQSRLNRLMIMQGISYSDWIPYSGIPDLDRELNKNIVKFTPQVAKAYEEGKMDKLSLDEQTNLIMETLKEYSAEALDMTLVNFPDVRMKMEMGKELNKWEMRVFERNMKAKTGKSFSDIYEDIKSKRRVKEQMLDMQRTLDIDMTGKGTWTIKE